MKGDCICMCAERRKGIEKEYEKFLNVMSECTEDYIFLFDLTNDYYNISEKVLEMFDLPDSKFDNATEKIMKVVHPEDKQKLLDDVEEIVSGKKSLHNLEYRWIDKNGKTSWINCAGKLVENTGELKILIGRIHRLGIKRKADDLTGLLSEDYFKINFEKTQRQNGDDSKYLMLIGIDNLKAINQRCGIAGGDRALKYVSDAIKKCKSSIIRAYRMDGDEFTLRIDGDFEQVKQVYYDIRQELDYIISENEYEIFFTISAGIIDFEKGLTFDETKVRMEFALNQAKRCGRNCFSVYDDEKYKEYMKLLDVQELLRESVNNNFEGYEVYYQPIVDSETGSLTGAEALLRWKCEKYGSMSPVQFIPILEESGLIIPVGKWVASTAIKQCKEWQKFIPDFKININLSYIQIKKSNVVADILSLVDSIGINPEYLTFEFTESTYIENDMTVRRLIKTFNEEGISLALDDFGTGYSNLAYLQNLNVDIIKIDRSFVNKAMSDENVYSVISHIIDMAHNLKLFVCIEGVENEDEKERLAKLFPDAMQGYLYGRPVPAEQFFRENIASVV